MATRVSHTARDFINMPISVIVWGMLAIFKKPVVAAVLAVVVVIVIITFASRRGGDAYTTVAAIRGTITQEISVTGKVVPAEKVNLAFEKTGRVTRVAVAVGDTAYRGAALITLEAADAVAELAQAEAQRETKKAELARDEAAPRDAEQNLRDKLRDAYTRADDAIRGKTDQFFSNPRTQPALTLQASTAAKNSIEFNRVLLEAMLMSWRDSANTVEVRENLNAVVRYLDELALVVNALTPTPNLSQTTIETHRSDVLAARTNTNTALANLTAAEEKRRVAEDAIAPQSARVKDAEAKVSYARTQLAKTVLRSPLNGVVTAVDIKAGELVSPNVAVVSLISSAEPKIEAHVPEADIAELKVGAEAEVTLDAYGNETIFRAAITAIDPAETTIDGVSTYKTTLQFTEKDERIRSGMTANIDIVTAKKEGVMVLPLRTIIQKNGGRSVRVLRNGTAIETPVALGLRGKDGVVEMLTGIYEGDVVVVPST